MIYYSSAIVSRPMLVG